MSVRKKVSMKQVILQVVEETDEIYIKHLPLLMKWGKQSYARINGNSSFPEEIAHLTITDNKVRLPMDAIYVEAVFMGNLDLKPGQWMNEDVMIDRGSINRGGVTENFVFTKDFLVNSTRVAWQIQDNYIVFQAYLDQKDITLIYLKIQSDPQGIPLVDEEQVEAIAKFIEWRLAEKQNSLQFRKGALRQNDLIYAKNLKKEYHILVSKSRAITTPSEHYQVALMLNFPWTGSSVI